MLVLCARDGPASRTKIRRSGLNQPFVVRFDYRDMIPVRLSVRNFLCYRENVPTLDFQGIHVACLCGSNGHGKSALLDAITWCLWGESRAKTQDALISYGAEEMRVELEFVARDTSYRVIRSRSRGGGRRRQGSTDLQFQVLGDLEQARPIPGNNIRETQARIEQTIGMDYDSFVNSAFLLQGRADEFTNKTPADRKAVLAKILGLDDYDRLQELAKKHLDENKTGAAEMEGSLTRLVRDIEAIGDPAQELDQIKVHLDAIDRQADDNRRVVDELRAKVTELERRRDQSAELQGQIEAHRREIQQVEMASAAGQERINHYLKLTGDVDAIRAGAGRLAKARERLDLLEATRSRFDRLTEHENRLLRAIEGSRSMLEGQVKQLIHRVEVELPPKANAEDELIEQRERAHAHLESLEEEKTRVVAGQDKLNKLSTVIGEAQGAAERYRLEGLALRSKLELLDHSSREGAGAVCPLCQTSLGGDGCGRLAQTYQKDIAEKRNLYRQNQASLQRLEAGKADLGKDVDQQQKALTTALREGDARIQRLELLVRESREAQSELAQVKSQLEIVRTSLESKAFAQAEHSALETVREQIKSLGYSEEERQQCYADTRALQPFEQQLASLSQAQDNLPAEEESLTSIRELLERRRDDLKLVQQRRQADEEAISQLPLWQQRLAEAEVVQSRIQDSRQAAIARQGWLEGERQRLLNLRGEVAKDEARLAVYREDEGIYQELMTAFGRQGIQAMLIETVVPRLEEEANVLLGRMTDNRMHVKMETQRERRSGQGDPIETLQINVSDELGPRSYEMYSGGESFRVNLALRIALSKVLAQRMGAPLPTLFIDEGFGSQDAAGRERILDVISAIEDDFDKIIVITHLEELKDAFPVRIEVQKEETGSTFWIS